MVRFYDSGGHTKKPRYLAMPRPCRLPETGRYFTLANAVSDAGMTAPFMSLFVEFAVFVPFQEPLDETPYLASGGGIEVLTGFNEPVTQLLVKAQNELRVLFLLLFLCHGRLQSSRTWARAPRIAVPPVAHIRDVSLNGPRCCCSSWPVSYLVYIRLLVSVQKPDHK